MSGVELFKRIIIRDCNGKIKFDSGLVPSNSFVIAFLKHVYGDFKHLNLSIKGVSASSYSVDYVDGANPKVRHCIDAPDNNSSYGLVVGTGNTAEDNEDYKLDTQIDHGTGAGELDYGAHSFTSPSVVGSNVDMVVSRDFYNGSGSSITVNEIGIYCASGCDGGVNTRYFCILRDVLVTPGIVGNTETLTIQYTFRTTV